MKKLILILVAFGVANIQAMETKYGIGVSNKDLSSSVSSVDYNNIELSYYASFDNNFAAEFSFSTGVNDKRIAIDFGGPGLSFFEYSGGNSYFLKGIYNINDTFYVSAIYADLKIDLKINGASLSIKDEDFGYGFGVNYQIPNSENIIRIGFESYDYLISISDTKVDLDKIALTYLF